MENSFSDEEIIEALQLGRASHSFISKLSTLNGNLILERFRQSSLISQFSQFQTNLTIIQQDKLKSLEFLVSKLDIFVQKQICDFFNQTQVSSFTKSYLSTNIESEQQSSRIMDGLLKMNNLVKTRQRLEFIFDKWKYQIKKDRIENKCMKTLVEAGNSEKENYIHIVNKWKHKSYINLSIYNKLFGYKLRIFQCIIQTVLLKSLSLHFKQLTKSWNLIGRAVKGLGKYVTRLSFSRMRWYTMNWNWRSRKELVLVMSRLVKKVLMKPFYRILNKQDLLFHTQIKKLHILFQSKRRQRFSLFLQSIMSYPKLERQQKLIRLVLLNKQILKNFNKQTIKRWKDKIEWMLRVRKGLKTLLSYFKKKLEKVLHVWNLKNNRIISFLNNRLKAKILVSCQKLQPSLSLTQCFHRWQIRCNQNLIKNYLLRIMLYSKISKFNVFYRMVQLVEKKQYRPIISKDYIRTKALKMTSIIYNSGLKYKATLLFHKWAMKCKQKQKLQRFTNSLEKVQLFSLFKFEVLSFRTIDRHCKEYRSKKKFLVIMLRNMFMQIGKGFKEWKRMPDLIFKRNQKRVKKFLKGLFLFSNKRKREISQMFWRIYEQGIDSKIKVFRRWIQLYGNQRNKAFYKWANLIAQTRLQQTFNFTTNLFQEVNSSFLTQLNPIFRQRFKKKSTVVITKKIQVVVLRLQQDVLQRIRCQAEIIEDMRWERKYHFCHKIFLSKVLKCKNFFLKAFQLPISSYKVNKHFVFQLKLKSVYLQNIRYCNETMKKEWNNGVHDKMKLVGQWVNGIRKGLIQVLKYWAANGNTQWDKKRNLFFLRVWESLEKSIKKNTHMIMKLDKEVNVKEKCLHSMLKYYLQCRNQFFTQWKSKAIIMKLEKQYLSQKMQKSLDDFIHIHQKVYSQTLEKLLGFFFKNHRFVNIQITFFNRLLNTKSGLFFLSFGLWKNMPEPINKYLRHKATKFQKCLQDLFMQELKISYQGIKNEWVQGELKKKRTVNTLVNKTAQEINKAFIQWSYRVKQGRIILSCRISDLFMQSLETMFKDNLKMLFMNNREAFLMHSCLKKLFLNQGMILEQSYRNWKETVETIRLHEKMNQEQRGFSTQILERFALRKEINSDKIVVKMFYLNYKIRAVSTNFLNQLCNNKQEKIIQAHNLWKYMPEVKNKVEIARAQKFQFKLANLVNYAFRTCLKQFQLENEEGELRKKTTISVLIRIAEGRFKKMFNLWSTFARTNKLETKCKLCISIHQHLSQISREQLRMFFSSNQEIALKQKCISLIIKNCGSNKQVFWRIWKNQVESIKINQKINQSMKVRLIDSLQSFLDNSHSDQLRKIIVKFFSSHRTYLVIKKMYTMLLNSELGKIHLAISNWKQIPDVPLSAKKTWTTFYMRMVKFSQSRIRVSFEQVKIEKSIGDIKKKDAVFQLMKRTFSQVNKYFLRLVEINRRVKTIEKYRLIKVLIKSCSLNLKASTHLFINSSISFQKRFDTLYRVTIIFQGKLGQRMQQWNKNAQKLTRFQNQAKKIKSQAIRSFQESLIRFWNFQSSTIVDSFYLNYRIKEVQLRFFNKLLGTKMSQTCLFIRKLKLLPDLKNKIKLKNGMLFYRCLYQLLWQKNSQELLRELKNVYEEGQLLKKRSVIILFRETESELKRKFNFWKEMTNKNRIFCRCIRIENVFRDMACKIEKDVEFFMENQESKKIQINCIYTLIKKTLYKLENAFSQWKNTAKIISLNKQMSNEKKKIMIEAIIKFLKGSDLALTSQIMAKFYHNHRICKIHTKFLNRILQTNVGNCIQSFYEWKNMPIKLMSEKKIKANRFQSNLFFLFRNNLSFIYKQFREKRQQGIIVKKKSITLLLTKVMREQKIKFLQWKEMNKTFIYESKIKYQVSLFSNCNSLFEQLFQFFIVEKKKSFKTMLAMQILSRSKFKQLQLFHKWYENGCKQYAKRQQLKKQRHKGLLNLIEITFKFDKLIIKEAIQTYNIGRKCYLLQKKVFQMMIENKKDLARLIFKQMKEIPIASIQKMQLTKTFANNLNSFFLKKLKAIHKVFKCIRTDGNLIKRQSCIKFINKSCGLVKKYIYVWKQIKLQNNIHLKIDKIFKQFEYLNGMNRLNVMEIFCSRQTKLIENTLKQLIKICAFNLTKYIRKWKKTTMTENNKITAIKRLLIKSSNIEKRMFLTWMQIAKEQKIMFIVQSFFKMFQICNSLCCPLFSFPKPKKNKVLIAKQIFNNAAIKTQFAFRQWKKVFQVQRVNQSVNMKQIILSQLVTMLWKKSGLILGCVKIKEYSMIETVRIYINSLWRWKLANTQSQYYSRYLKLFRQSQQIFTITSIFEKKFVYLLGSGFNRISKYNRGFRLVQILNNVDNHNEKKIVSCIKRVFNIWNLQVKEQNKQFWKNLYFNNARANKIINISNKIQKNFLAFKYKHWRQKILFIQSVEMKIQKLLNQFKSGLVQRITNWRDKVRMIKFKKLNHVRMQFLRFRKLLISKYFNKLMIEVKQIGLISKFSQIIQKIIKSHKICFAFNNMKQLSQYRQNIILIFACMHMICNKLFSQVLNSAYQKLKLHKRKKLILQSLVRVNSLQKRKEIMKSIKVWKNAIRLQKITSKVKGIISIMNICSKSTLKIKYKYLSMWIINSLKNKWYKFCIQRMALNVKITTSLPISLWRLKMLI